MKTYLNNVSMAVLAIDERSKQLYAACALSLVAALVHAALAPHHWEEWWGSGVFFVIVAVAQAAGGIALLWQPRLPLLLAGIGGNLSLVLLYVVSHTIGLPSLIMHSHGDESALLDLAANGAELGIAAILLELAWNSTSPRFAQRGPSAAPFRVRMIRSLVRHPRVAALTFFGAFGLVMLGFAFLGGTSELTTNGLTASQVICVGEDCSTQLTATLIGEEQAQRMGLAAEIGPRFRTSQPFLLSVNTHEGSIQSLSLDDKVFVRVAGQAYPAAEQTLQVSAHHNNYLVFFPKFDMYGHAIFGPEPGLMPEPVVGQEAEMPGHNHTAMASQGAAQAPLQYEIIINDLPGDAVIDASTFRAVGQAAAPSLAAILGLVGGFLASMWPCLFQLTAYFIPSLAGISMQQARSTTTTAEMRWRVIRTALYFVAGITVVYTTAGAVAGYASQSLQGEPLFEELRRPLAVIAGIVILIMAARVAAKARVPLVCHMPLVSFRKEGETGPLATMITGVAFATGCMSCFGAVIALGMLTYIASSGSPLSGALILFAFSLGISVPLVLTATVMAHALPFLGKLERWAPVMGIASSVIMVGFALILITDNYHAVSDLISRTVGIGYPL